MNETYHKNNIGLKIMTPDGFSDFEGVVDKGLAHTISIHTDTNHVSVTPEHQIWTDRGKVKAEDLCNKDMLWTDTGLQSVRFITDHLYKERVYDIFGVKKSNRFLADGIVVSNCEFVIYDETLINALKILKLEASEPMFKTGQVRWYKKPKKGNVYIVTLDPSLGTGGDNAAIEVFEYPSQEQVAEWCHNKTPIHGQIHLLREILKQIGDEIGYTDLSPDPELFWSVENNSIGEACLIVIEDTGEETFKGEFVSEPKKSGAGSRRSRKGFTTTNKSKLLACSLLKTAIESDNMKIRSRPLISELKNFVAIGNSYAAKIGEKDDLVSAALLNVRVADQVKRHNEKVMGVMNQGIEGFLEDWQLPMPMTFL